MPAKRINSLDGLRGIAALIVVVYHSLLVAPSFWNRISGRAVANPIQWLLAYTPLRIFWAGGEAVWVFFVLSGFVLVRPYLARRELRCGRYYLRRAIRLYLPFVGSFAFAVLLRAMQGKPSGDAGGWIFIHRIPTSFWEGFKSLFLFAGDSTTLNGAWWSLRWEVWFSALLPLVVIAVRRHPNHGKATLVGSLVLVGLGGLAGQWLPFISLGHANPVLYLPMFGVGVALAMLEPQIHQLFGTMRRAAVALLTLAGIAALTSTVALQAAASRLNPDPVITWLVAGPIGIAGAGLLVALALAAPGLSDLLSHRRLDWLGRRSFTLYLIHEPLIVTMVIVLGISTVTWWSIPAGIAVSLAGTALLYPIIERPALRLIRRIPAGADPPQTTAHPRTPD